MIALRAFARLVTFVLLVALALAGLAAAVSSIRGGGGPLSLSWLADLLNLSGLRDSVATFREGLEGSGAAPLLSALGGAAAVLLGLLLLVALLAPRRERTIVLDSDSDSDDSRVTARRRPLGQAAETLVEQVRGVTGASVKVRGRRRGGGRIRVTADRTRSADADAVSKSADDALEDLTSAFKLKARVRTRLGESGSRVQ